MSSEKKLYEYIARDFVAEEMERRGFILREEATHEFVAQCLFRGVLNDGWRERLDLCFTPESVGLDSGNLLVDIINIDSAVNMREEFLKAYVAWRDQHQDELKKAYEED